jgi:hypothetical protein
MAKDSTALPLHDDRSSRGVNSVRLVGDVAFEQAPDARTSKIVIGTGTSAESRPLVSAPKPISFVVAMTTESVVLQVWEGTVTAIGDREFTAILRDKTEEKNPDEEVVLSTDELATEDRPLVRLGAVFYWSVRYEQERGLPRRRISRLRFRRIPGWTDADIRRSEEVRDRLRALWSNDAEVGANS